MLYISLRPGQTCHSKDGGSCRFRWPVMGRDCVGVKITRCCHKRMHRKWVTCELHDSYFRSMMIKHAIPKTVEVAYSVGQLWEEIAWAWRRVHTSTREFVEISIFLMLMKFSFLLCKQFFS